MKIPSHILREQNTNLETIMKRTSVTKLSRPALYLILSSSLATTYILPYPIRDKWTVSWNYGNGKIILEKRSFGFPTWEYKAKESEKTPNMPPETLYNKNA